MIELGILEKIKNNLDSFVGQSIRLKANRGRKRVLEVEGVLEQTYPKVFVIRLREKQMERRLSYSYADLLTKAVELSFQNKKIGYLS